MKRRIWWAWFLGVTVTGCVAPYVPLPPAPVPPAPVPVDPVDPGVPRSKIASWEAVQKVVKGMTADDAHKALGVPWLLDTPQDEPGESVREYATAGPNGEPQYLDLRIAGGVVVGRSRLPRVGK